tara:strand:+ start:50 stop:469 length:420 start_codon:yes stop_codon:yes gene_type:complete
MDYSLSGGSLASSYVNQLAKERCSKLKGGVHHHSKTSKKSHKKSSSKKQKKPKSLKKNKNKKSRKKSKSKMKGGGSDWVTMLYSRGPVNNPSTYNEELLRKFSKTGAFYDSQGKLNKRGNTGGGKRKSTKRKSKKDKKC